MKRIVVLFILLLQNNFIFANGISTNSSSLKSLNNSRIINNDTKVQSPIISIKNFTSEVDFMQKLHHLQMKIDEILNCCKNKCPDNNDTSKAEICNEKSTKQTIPFRSNLVKMVLPERKCISCPCPTIPTTCPVMPADHCPCNVKIGQLLPCPAIPDNFQTKNQRQKRQMAEVIVSLDDKLAVEYLKKLGYVEESNLSPANICHPSNLPANYLFPDQRTAAVVPVGQMLPFQATAMYTNQQIPTQIPANPLLQKIVFDGMQPMNFALIPQQQQQQQIQQQQMQQQLQEKHQRLISSGLTEQSQLTDLLASSIGTELKMNDNCQYPGRAKSATVPRSKIILTVVTIIFWIKSLQDCNM